MKMIRRILQWVVATTLALAGVAAYSAPVVVQQCFDTFAQSTTANCTLPSSVTAGNSIIVATQAYGGGASPILTVSDGVSYTAGVQQLNNEVAGGAITAGVFYRHNHPAGSTTVTATNPVSAADSYGYIHVYEVSGLVNAAPNRTVGNFPVGSGSTTPTSGTTAATTVADIWDMAVLTANSVGSNAGINVPAATGYTNLFVDQSSAVELAGSIDVKTVAVTGAQSASWGTMLVSAPWVAVLAGFEISSTPPPTTKVNPLSGLGGTASQPIAN